METMISIIIPAFNCADSIRNTIDSIIRSGVSDYEIIIVDDGSTDGTDRICDELMHQYQLIRCIHQKNKGVSAARNCGLKEAKGEYFWFFDADDTARENSFDVVVQAIRAYRPDIVIFGMEFDHYHKGKIFRRDEMLPPFDGLETVSVCNDNLYDLFASNSLSSLCTRVIKRSIADKMDFWLREDMILYEDLEFSLRIWNQCSNVYFCGEVIYQYKQSENGSNAGRRLLKIPHIPDLLQAIEDVIAFGNDKNRILLELCIMLSSEKIAVSSRMQIDTICKDFKTWIDTHSLLQEIEARPYSMLMYKGRISDLIKRRACSKIRHSTANWIKQNIGDFRKWKFLS